MLNIYVGKENLPKDIQFVFDVDSYFSIAPSIPKTETTELILKQLENAEYVDEHTFKDRESRNLDVTMMSTGAKALILCSKFKEYIINFSEVGSNAWDLLKDIKDCSIYLNDASVFRLYCRIDNIRLNGENIGNTDELNDRLEAL